VCMYVCMYIHISIYVNMHIYTLTYKSSSTVRGWSGCTCVYVCVCALHGDCHDGCSHLLIQSVKPVQQAQQETTMTMSTSFASDCVLHGRAFFFVPVVVMLCRALICFSTIITRMAACLSCKGVLLILISPWLLNHACICEASRSAHACG
jgi:hypothetical protein